MIEDEVRSKLEEMGVKVFTMIEVRPPHHRHKAVTIGVDRLVDLVRAIVDGTHNNAKVSTQELPEE